MDDAALQLVRKLVVGLGSGDVITFYPKGTRQKVSAPIADVYAWVLRRRAAVSLLEKARERKAALSAKREAKARQAAENRLRQAAQKARHEA